MGLSARLFGATPLLSVGYVAGIDSRKTKSGGTVNSWIINAAFNSGNSGGPLLNSKTGRVIGVVSSKLAPISPGAQSALKALGKQKSGIVYPAKRRDGTVVEVTQGQIIGMILKELRQQVQLVIGRATLLGDLKAFLRANDIQP